MKHSTQHSIPKKPIEPEGSDLGKNNPFYGKHHSAEARKKMSEAKKGHKNPNYGKYYSDEKRKKMSGKHLSIETRRKISKAKMGHKVSTETREKLSKSRKGIFIGNKHPLYGKSPSIETRKKLSEALKGHKPSIEARRKMSDALKGRHLSEEHLRKMSEARKGKYQGKDHPFYGKHHTEETKKKMRGKHHTEESKKKISEALKGKYIGENSHNWKGGDVEIICKVCGKKKHVRRIDIRRGRGKFCSHRCNGIWSVKHQRNKDTDIERLMETELIKQNIPYLKQAPVEGIALVDFLLPNKIIVQCDGKFWHASLKQKDIDTNQDFILGFKGYKVFRFTDSDIKKSANKCVNKIIGDTYGIINPLKKSA